MTDEKRKILPDPGHYYVVGHPSSWPEEGLPGWCPQIEACSPEGAVEEWAKATEKSGGFSGDPYPDADEMLVRDSEGAEWKVYLSTDWDPSFTAHDKEPA
jgi:hypothetical protein